ncbi:gliding motility protein GldL [Ferruginibacter lapsinanis]|uniref:type IX secretion system motor protein PorL/GldL n=1 Tax=Ferruginibacter lapsinanis TaxID=563172 RepID=UPI001E38E050|nr:gliding motility protein GldL [Ferruginibacter lapsinanis]UEG51157.1 gliding motility protein GldL [Ferruginibacter lapsinanis]
MAAGQSRPIDRILNIFVSAAAVPVLLGALFKITHAPGADIWLKIGLYTESVIFLGYALLYVFAPPPEAPMPAAAAAESGNPALKSMDKMLQEADITPANMKKLSEGFQKLGATVGGMTEIGDVVKSTSDFGAKTKEATAAIGSMSTAFTNSANTMASFNNASESARGFHEQVQVLTKNLGSLNTIYELELKESNNHLKALNGFYGKMAEASQAMMSSVDDANKAKEQIGALATNLGKLNSVYGNMLSAMQGR